VLVAPAAIDLAVPAAASARTVAVRSGIVTGCDIADDTLSTVPWLSVTTTASPPTMGRPWYVRSYGTYCKPPEPPTTSPRTNASPGPLARSPVPAAVSWSADATARAVGERLCGFCCAMA
jgi:hypothetical protein